jgi:hypothetical protein
VVLQCCGREVSLIQVIVVILQINAISTVKKRHDVGLCCSSGSYSPQRTRFNPRPVHAKSVVDKVALRHVPPPSTSIFQGQYHYTNTTYLFTCWWCKS